jgi:hypothetical protein
MSRVTMERTRHQQTFGELAVGIGAGLLLALLTSLIPVVVIVVLSTVAAATWIRLIRAGRAAMLAGTMLSSGLVLSWGVVRIVQSCSQTADFCGNANVWPLLAFSVVGVLTGLAGATVSIVRARR